MLQGSMATNDAKNPAGTTQHTPAASWHSLSADESGAGELGGWGKLPDIVRLPVSLPTIREADWKQAWAASMEKVGLLRKSNGMGKLEEKILTEDNRADPSFCQDDIDYLVYILPITD